MSKHFKTKSSIKLSKILSEVISTPLERVLKILQDIVSFLKTIPYDTVNKEKELQWVINIISNRTIYNIELNNNYELIEKYKNEFPEFQPLLDSINQYTGTENEIRKFNQLIKKTVKIIENKNDKTSFKELGLQMPSLAYKNKKKKSGKNKNNLNVIKNQKDSSDDEDDDNSSSSDDLEKKFIKGNMFKSHSFRDLKLNMSVQTKDNNKNNNNLRRMTQLDNKNLLKFNKKILDKENMYKKLVSIKENNSSSDYDESNSESFSENGEEIKEKLNFSDSENLDSENSFNNIHQSDDEILLNKDTKKKNTDNGNNISPSAIEKFKENFTTIIAETKLLEKNYDPKNILNKDFDIHEFRKIVGYNNVLPLVGKYIFQKFRLGEKVINTSKLDKFFSSLSNGYYELTLYHNAIHASDVTQTAALMILNSNFEEIAFTNITDILSIITACLGHDLGHPGVNNQFLINTSSDLALTYNDLSPLENFHTSNLFKIIKIEENNILDKVSNIVFKSFRKRVINSILATDMVQHSKVLGIIKSKIELNNEKKFFVIKESKNVFEDQQALIDFMIHCCDLAHNTKKFSISLRWVELLSNEFWKQGDKESKENMPISFLCDRNNYDIPKSQVGFIKAFITPTFEVLVDIFPNLKFFLNNALKNLDEWKKLNEKGRKRGWTPNKDTKSRRISKINTDMNIDINPKKEKNILLNKFSNDIDINNNNYNINKK